MAKRGTLTHRRTRRLASALGIEVPYALGVMEAIFHATADKAKRGDLGRLSDQDIADEIFYSGDAGKLIRALVDAGVLDADERHRLVVHGWSEHADDAVHVALYRSVSTFADGSVPNPRRISKSERERLEPSWAPVRTEAHEERTRAHNSAPPRLSPALAPPRQSPAKQTACAPAGAGRVRRSAKASADRPETRELCDALAEISGRAVTYSATQLEAFARLLDAGRTAEDVISVCRAYVERSTSSARFARDGAGARGKAEGGPGLAWALRPGEKGGFDAILLQLGDGGARERDGPYSEQSLKALELMGVPRADVARATKGER